MKDLYYHILTELYLVTTKGKTTGTAQRERLGGL